MTQTSDPASPRKVRILLVDDSAVMRSLLRMVLEPQPSIEIVAAASSGEAGLAAFASLHPDLVLLDIEMPGMNGLEVLSTIRRSDRRVPVIMCSTLTSRGARITIEALTRGATDYVAKPGAQNGIREGVETLTRELLPKILALFPSKARPIRRNSFSRTSTHPPARRVSAAEDGRHRDLHRRPRCSRTPAPQNSRQLPAAHPHRAAHAAPLYRPAR